MQLLYGNHHNKPRTRHLEYALVNLPFKENDVVSFYAEEQAIIAASYFCDNIVNLQAKVRPRSANYRVKQNLIVPGTY